MFSNSSTKNPINKNKNRKIWTNFGKFSEIFNFFSYSSAQNGNSVFLRSSANFGEDLEESRGDKIYSLGNPGVKKGPGSWGTRNGEFLVPSLDGDFLLPHEIDS